MDPGTPRHGHLGRQVRRAAEAVDAQAPALGEIGQAQRPVPDDPRAQEWSGRHVVETIRQEIGVALVDEGEFGVAAVDVPTGEARIQAEVLPPGEAEAAAPAGSGEPRDADALPLLPARAARPESVDRADHLVAGRDEVPVRGEIALRQMQVSPADPAGEDPDADLPGPGFGHRSLQPDQRSAIHGSGAVDGPRRHGRGRSHSPVSVEAARSRSP